MRLAEGEQATRAASATCIVRSAEHPFHPDANVWTRCYRLEANWKGRYHLHFHAQTTQKLSSSLRREPIRPLAALKLECPGGRGARELARFGSVLLPASKQLLLISAAAACLLSQTIRQHLGNRSRKGLPDRAVPVVLGCGHSTLSFSPTVFTSTRALSPSATPGYLGEV